MDRRTEEREKERASDAMDRSDAVAVCLCVLWRSTYSLSVYNTYPLIIFRIPPPRLLARTLASRLPTVC